MEAITIGVIIIIVVFILIGYFLYRFMMSLEPIENTYSRPRTKEELRVINGYKYLPETSKTSISINGVEQQVVYKFREYVGDRQVVLNWEYYYWDKICRTWEHAFGSRNSTDIESYEKNKGSVPDEILFA